MQIPNLRCGILVLLVGTLMISIAPAHALNGDGTDTGIPPASMKKTEVVGASSSRRVASEKAKKERSKRVEVTGSRIRVKAPTAQEIQHADAQIQVMDQAQIRRTGGPDLSGVLSRLPSTR